MGYVDKNGKLKQYRGGRPLGAERILLKVGYSTLAELFEVSIWTVKKWCQKKLLDPTSLPDIVDKYNNRYKLDRRRRG